MASPQVGRTWAGRAHWACGRPSPSAVVETAQCSTLGCLVAVQLTPASGTGHPQSPAPPAGPPGVSSRVERGQVPPSAALSVLLSRPSPARPWLQGAAGKPAPFTTRNSLRPSSGPSSAAPSSFQEGEVGRPGGTGQTKQTNWAASGVGPARQLCGRVGLGTAKSATFQPLPRKAINKRPHWAGRRKPQ